MLMKNRLLIFILSLCFLNSQAFTEEFIFKTKNIEIIDNGKFITAGKGKVISSDRDLEINANKLNKAITNDKPLIPMRSLTLINLIIP